MTNSKENLMKTNTKCWIVACLSALLLVGLSLPAAAASSWPKMAVSRDNTPISYEVYGNGEPTLLFVHGWSCDSRYWRMQVDQFAKKYRVVVMDLAGHGHSGMGRACYSMQGFAEVEQAVAEAVGSKSVILIGHSMAGEIVAHAARLMPERVIGLIGVDSLDNIEYPLSREFCGWRADAEHPLDVLAGLNAAAQRPHATAEPPVGPDGVTYPGPA